MLENGFVKLHRSILKWEWYDDVNTKVVFLHLLLTVSIEDAKWHGITVKRGSRVSSYAKLSKETGLSVKQIRTAIDHLEATGEVARTKHPKYTVFAINNFDVYQTGASKTADNRQGNGKVGASCGQQYKKVKEYTEKVEEDKEDILFLSDLSSARARESAEEERAGDVRTDEMTVDEYRDYLLATMPESAISSGLVESLVQAHAKKRT
nr:MAG TPA: replisome organizer [Caudoviricetes sp.]